MNDRTNLDDPDQEQRVALLDDLEDTRLEMQPHHGTWAAAMGRAIDWINGEEDGTLPPGQQREASPCREPVLLGRFHHGQGYLCSGSMRLLRADFDTNPSEEFRDEVLDWIAEVMNAELRSAARRGLPSELAVRAPAITWPQGKSVQREQDMGDGYLRVVLDSDNDVVVAVWDGKRSASVEFCNPGAGGGGRSPKTRAALINLMSAIEAERETPVNRVAGTEVRMNGTEAATPNVAASGELHGLDTSTRVCFYEQDFYVLSNFSSFNLQWKGHTFPTSEHAYHWEKFEGVDDAWNAQGSIARQVLGAPSAHEAFKLANEVKGLRRPDWDDVKLDIMRGILRAKTEQHEYVRRKLLATGDRELVENSWRDDYWGWGPNQDGQNMLGKLWMEIRAELRGRREPR